MLRAPAHLAQRPARRPRRRQLSTAAAATAASPSGGDRPAVLITGSNSGIGQATALLLAKQGWEVFAGVRSGADTRALTDQPDIHLVVLDVCDQASVDAAAAAVALTLGRRPLSGLVNNAGKGVFAPLELMPVSTFEDVLQTNVTGVLRVTQAFVPLLRAHAPAQRPGRIVNLGSYAGTIALPMFGAYAASKFALEALSDSMRYELFEAHGISTSLIKAGAVRTPIWARSFRASTALMDTFEQGSLAPYQALSKQVFHACEQAEQNGIDADEVAATVLRALTEARPSARYVLGNGAGGQMLARRLLPDWLWDRLLLGGLMREK